MCMPAFADLLPEWAFRDQRLRRRALRLLEALFAAPGLAFAGVFGKLSSDIKQAYDFCENDAVSLPSLLAPSFFVTGTALRERFGTVLCLQDTTELDLTTHRAMQGLGEIGNSVSRGIYLHPGFAVTTDGLPLGLLSALTWVRDPAEHGKAVTRTERPFDLKESAKWWKTIENAEQMVDCPGRLVHVGDRECDVFDVLARSAAAGFRVLCRASQDRSLLDAPHAHLWAEAESWRVVGFKTIDIPARPATKDAPARAARTASVALRFGSVTVAQPKDASGFLTLSVVLLREVDPPSSTDVIEWLLLTTDVVTTAADAWIRVDWYRRRWLIEELFKCLKTVCRIEARQFRKRPHFETYLALVLLVCARILFLRNIARLEPDTPVQEVISPEEEVVLRAAHNNGAKKPLQPVLTAYTVVRFIAVLGGFLARKGDGEPGIQTLARGYSKLQTLLQGYRLAEGHPSPKNPLLAEIAAAPLLHFRRHAPPA